MNRDALNLRNSTLAKNLVIAGCMLSSLGLVACDQVNPVDGTSLSSAAQLSSHANVSVPAKPEQRSGLPLNHNATFLFPEDQA